jgi:hypothetical protein
LIPVRGIIRGVIFGHGCGLNDMNYPQPFEELWLLRPQRVGNNPKRKAYNAYNARLKDGHTHQDMIEGLKRYTAFCKVSGTLNTPYVMHMATFLGPDENFMELWEPPKPQVKDIGAQQGYPPGFDPTRQCGGGESAEQCKLRAWREYERKTA